MLTPPGAIALRAGAGLADANEFLTVEEWRSEADVAAHMRTPHVAALLAKVPSLVTAPPEIRSYRTLA